MCTLVPDHSDHAPSDWPRVMRYGAVLLLMVLVAITLKPFVDDMVMGRPHPAAPKPQMRTPRVPARTCAGSGDFVFVSDGVPMVRVGAMCPPRPSIERSV